jgi:hypothetical protein
MGKDSTRHTVRRNERSDRGWGGGDKFNGREKNCLEVNKKNVFVFCILILNTLGKMFSTN